MLWVTTEWITDLQYRGSFLSSSSLTNTVPHAAAIHITPLVSRNINCFCMQHGCVWPSLGSGASEFIVLFPQGVSKLMSLELHSHCPGLGSRLRTLRDTEAFRDPCEFLWEMKVEAKPNEEIILLFKYCSRSLASAILACGVGDDVLLIPGCVHRACTFIYTSTLSCRARWDQRSNSHESLR